MADYRLDGIPRQVWAHYHPFYGTPAGPTGRWLTWNEPHWLSKGYGYDGYAAPAEMQQHLRHDPDTFLGPGRRCTYSAYYPTLGLYDSLDAGALEQHARWAVDGALDGLLWDYQLVGEDNSDRDKPLGETIYDRSMRAMLGVVERHALPLQLCPMYDSYCWYGFTVPRIVEHLGYLAATYHGHARMLHVEGRLVVFLYSTFAKHTAEDWRRIRALLDSQGTDKRLFLVAGEMDHWAPDFCVPGLFDGFTQYTYELEDYSAQGVARLAGAMRNMAECNRVRFWTAPVAPGFDGRIWHHPGRVATRGLGKLYESMWQQAIEEQPPCVTICSFNEWGEGTQIEPCLEYEDLFLTLTAQWAQRFKLQERQAVPPSGASLHEGATHG